MDDLDRIERREKIDKLLESALKALVALIAATIFSLTIYMGTRDLYDPEAQKARQKEIRSLVEHLNRKKIERAALESAKSYMEEIKINIELAKKIQKDNPRRALHILINANGDLDSLNNLGLPLDLREIKARVLEARKELGKRLKEQ